MSDYEDENAEEIEIKDSDDLFTVEAFAASCRDGSFIDYDGMGYYCNGLTYNRGNRVHCMDVVEGLIDRAWSHVVWFNK